MAYLNKVKTKRPKKQNKQKQHTLNKLPKKPPPDTVIATWSGYFFF